MQRQLHSLNGHVEALVATFIPSPQSRIALDDLLRPAARPSRMTHLLRAVHPARIDWEAVGAASFIYVLAFVVWMYLAK
jgi:hypothetical protein